MMSDNGTAAPLLVSLRSLRRGQLAGRGNGPLWFFMVETSCMVGQVHIGIYHTAARQTGSEQGSVCEAL